MFKCCIISNSWHPRSKEGTQGKFWTVEWAHLGFSSVQSLFKKISACIHYHQAINILALQSTSILRPQRNAAPNSYHLQNFLPQSKTHARRQLVTLRKECDRNLKHIIHIFAGIRHFFLLAVPHINSFLHRIKILSLRTRKTYLPLYLKKGLTDQRSTGHMP